MKEYSADDEDDELSRHQGSNQVVLITGALWTASILMVDELRVDDHWRGDAESILYEDDAHEDLYDDEVPERVPKDNVVVRAFEDWFKPSDDSP